MAESYETPAQADAKPRGFLQRMPSLWQADIVVDGVLYHMVVQGMNPTHARKRLANAWRDNRLHAEDNQAFEETAAVSLQVRPFSEDGARCFKEVVWADIAKVMAAEAYMNRIHAPVLVYEDGVRDSEDDYD